MQMSLSMLVFGTLAIFVTKIKVLPYHNYAKAKYKGLDMNYPCEETLVPTKEETDTVADKLKAMNCLVSLN